jgi:hypothetical protein
MRPDNDDICARQVDERIDVITPTETKRRTPNQEEGHVGADTGSNATERRHVESKVPDFRQTENRHGGIRTTAPKTRLFRNALAQTDNGVTRGLAAATCRAPQQRCRFPDQVAFVGWDLRIVTLDDERSLARREREQIVQGE